MAQTATQPNFGSILDRPSSESVRPPAAPVGQYVSVIKGLPKRGESARNKTPFIEYTVQPLQPVEGTVDEEALESYGGLGGKEWKLTFYITEKSGYRHTEFLTNDLGVEDEDATHWERAQQAAGRQFIQTVKHESSEDGKTIFHRLEGTAPAE